MEKYKIKILTITCLCITLTASAAAYSQQNQIINIDTSRPGRTFEGIGALSAGASSRLLIDYPQMYRGQIFDYLFKPNHGAAFQHLKVEIGGNVNSTDGTEPSHARTQEELLASKQEHYARGYEWWLMREAKKRNPNIYLDCLQWGAPAWIGKQEMGEKTFYSQDNADYIVAFIKGAKRHHLLNFDYCGVWNERMYDPEWIKLLRYTLDKNFLPDVKIVAADMHSDIWKIADDMAKDPNLKDAVHTIGVHYPYKSTDCKSTETAKKLGNPLWSSEDGPWRGDWTGAKTLAKIYNKNYINGKMTKTIIWSLVTSYYENLPLPNSGVMIANTPWSGHYQVQPAVWATAHTTQFACPGWIYLDSACNFLDNGGSFVTLKNPNSNHYSIIIETVDAKQPQTLTFNLSQDLSKEKIHVWRPNKDSHFIKINQITPTNDSFDITLEPESFYSLTTTTGQKKGDTIGPPPSDFTFPYAEKFEKHIPGQQPKFFSDQGGTFEIAKRHDKKGYCLRQIVAEVGIEWATNPYPETFIGDNYWTDYEVSADTYIENAGFVSVFGRVGKKKSWSAEQPNAYWLRLNHDGSWFLNADTITLASGNVKASANQWHNLKLCFEGIAISAFIDDQHLTTVYDVKYDSGMAGLGSGWNNAMFDNFHVKPLTTTMPQPANPKYKNLAIGKTITASSCLSPDYDPQKANDDLSSTRFSAAEGALVDQWLQIDFGSGTTFDTVIVRAYKGFQTRYKIQHFDGSKWIDTIKEKDMAASPELDSFEPVTAEKIRIYFTSVPSDTPSIWEFEIYNTGQSKKPAPLEQN